MELRGVGVDGFRLISFHLLLLGMMVVQHGFSDVCLECHGGVPVQSGKIITVVEVFCFYVIILSVDDDQGIGFVIIFLFASSLFLICCTSFLSFRRCLLGVGCVSTCRLYSESMACANPYLI
jgi:hypothetical protein